MKIKLINIIFYIGIIGIFNLNFRNNVELMVYRDCNNRDFERIPTQFEDALL